jgi:polyisoprenoid-binding protein YceI
MRNAALAVYILAAAPALAQAPGTALSVDTAESSVVYHLVHKLHKIDGTSKKLEGKAMLLPDGRAQVMVRVPVESFDSGNVNRDAHMKEAVEAAKFPTVELKALADGVTIPTTFPSTIKKTFKVQIVFHGEKGLLDVPVDITFESANKARANASFKISLDAYKVERPSLMFVKVDDDLAFDAKLVFKR